VLSLRTESGGVFAVRQDWTDASGPDVFAALGIEPPIHHIASLLELCTLVADLRDNVKEIHATDESAFAHVRTARTKVHPTRPASGSGRSGKSRQQHDRGPAGRGGNR
jgi:hypothetical protein